MSVNLLPEGQAQFEVRKIFYNKKDGTPLFTNKGDPKVSIMFHVLADNNNVNTIYHYFSPNTGWMNDALFKACGMGDLIELDFQKINWEVLIGHKGKCVIKTKAWGGNPEASVIDEFLYEKKGGKKEPEMQPLVEDSLEDICPF